MEIKKIFKRELQHLEHYQFANHLLTMAKEANVEKLTAVLKPLEDAFKAEDEAMFPKKGNEMNAQLRELDDRRDKAYYSLQHAVDAGLYSEETAELEAAKRIDEIMKRYAGVATMNYDKETGGLKNLLADLAETEAAKAVKVLHAEGAVKRLGDHNKAFDEAFRGRFAGDKKLFDMKALRCAASPTKPSMLWCAASIRWTTSSRRQPSPRSSTATTSWWTTATRCSNSARRRMRKPMRRRLRSNARCSPRCSMISQRP